MGKHLHKSCSGVREICSLSNEGVSLRKPVPSCSLQEVGRGGIKNTVCNSCFVVLTLDGGQLKLHVSTQSIILNYLVPIWNH